MIDSPKSLKHTCIDHVAKHFREIFVSGIKPLPGKRKRNSKGQLKSTTSTDEFYLPTKIAENLITSVTWDGSNGTEEFLKVFVKVFSAVHSSLQKVSLPDCKGLKSKHLDFLKGHKISMLEVCNSLLQYDEIIQCLGDWSRANLFYLSIPESIFLPTAILSVPFKTLKNLRYCNVSRTNFNTVNLEALVRDCGLLEGLDISETEVRKIGCLVQVKKSLKTLHMHKIRICEKTIIELTKLQTLDISNEDETLLEFNSTEFNVVSPTALRSILIHPTALQDIVSLDLSGRRGINIVELRQFILNRPKLKFLGLFYDESLCAEPMLRDKTHVEFNPNLKVAGTASKDQILIALDKYRMRTDYIHACIHNLITFAELYDMKCIEVRTEFVRLILDIIKQNPASAVQSISVYCLSYLIKHHLPTNFHPNLLLEVVALCLDLLEKYPNDVTVHKYVLLILTQPHLEDLEGIDRYRYCKLALESMCTHKSELIVKMAVNIAASLATKMTNVETTQVGTNKLFMQKLLSIVKDRVTTLKVDTTFNTTLTTLWNLTDESPKTCNTFIEKKGLVLFELALDAFYGDDRIETDIIGILSNIAEVKHLRKKLLKPKIVTRLREFLKSDEIDTSFYAVDILAHLVSDGDKCWTLKEVSRADILEEIHSVIVEKWKSPGREIAAYRSFTPYIHLLKCPEAPVQLFGAWAIYHVCFENPCRYAPFLKEEKLSECLDQLSKEEDLQIDVKNLVQKLVEYRDRPLPWNEDDGANAGQENPAG